MVNCNKIENDNKKVNYIKKDKYRPRRMIETNIENIAYLGKTMSLCNKQHLSNI